GSQDRCAAPPPGHHHGCAAQRVASRRPGRCRLDLGVGPLLPALRRAGRGPLRVLRAAGRHGRRDRPRGLWRHGHLQLLPEPGAAGGHGPHHRPPVTRAFHPGDRQRLVRARLRRVRLRLRHGAKPPQGSGRRPASHQGPAGQAEPATGAAATAAAHRRRRREGDPEAGGRARHDVERLWHPRRLPAQEPHPRRVVHQGREGPCWHRAHDQHRGRRGRSARGVPGGRRPARHPGARPPLRPRSAARRSRAPWL
ncbi:MAG: Putative oxidoreductase, partial [uncultured Acidimicrobiales bacterium]